MKYLQFTLSMPGAPSWNGKWSGEGNLYAKVVKFTERKKGSQERVAKLLEDPYYSYSWTDGWRAAVEVTEIDAATARKVKKASRGFCGYDWMVSSILEKGVITTDK